MSIVETITEYVSDSGGKRRVLLLPGTRHLLDRIPGAVPHEPGDPTPDGGALLVGAVNPGKEGAEVEAMASGVSEGGVLLLLLGSAPSVLRVGPLVQSLTAGGLRVVRAEQLEAPLAGTLIVACRGETLPLTSYLLEEVIPETDHAQARLINEWAVEGLQLRAVAASAATTQKVAEQQVRAAEEANVAAKAEAASLRTRLEDCAKDNDELRLQLERGLTWKLRSATQIVRDHPVGGTKRLGRLVLRRSKR